MGPWRAMAPLFMMILAFQKPNHKYMLKGPDHISFKVYKADKSKAAATAAAKRAEKKSIKKMSKVGFEPPGAIRTPSLTFFGFERAP